MFSTVLEEITGYLDRRFVLVLLFPSLLFWGGLLAMFSWPLGVANALAAWLKQDTALQLVEIVAGIAFVVFFASLLDNHMVLITRFYEGNWDKFLPGLGKLLFDLRQKHYQQVIEGKDREAIYYSYPPSKSSESYLKYVMPTRLGNILRNAELYPNERYKIDAVLMWPRLLAVLPDSFNESLASTKSSLDFNVNHFSAQWIVRHPFWRIFIGL